jgi:Cd2+/Zn2+-exporting ATPase
MLWALTYSQKFKFKMLEKNKAKKFDFDIFLFIILALALIASFFKLLPASLSGQILIVVGIIATLPVLASAFRAIIKRRVSIDLLAAVALIAALIAKEWFSVVFINLMITSARIFASFVEARSRRAIESLLKLKPEVATIEQDGKLIQVSLDKIKKGDNVIVGLGERIPVDGVILKGEASIDQSSMTGESMPVYKKKGEQVLSSTIVVSGNITVVADKIGKETAFEKIIDLVEKSQNNKAGVETLEEKFTVYYIFITIGVSILVYFFTSNINLVLALLLVSCADDIAVAVPMAIMTAITHSARDGAIIKGGNYIERLAKIKVIVFDKTGTLTKGKLKVKEVLTLEEKDESKILYIAGCLSAMSHHPIAAAVTECVNTKGIAIKEPLKFEEYPGKGMFGMLGKDKIAMGNFAHLEDLKIKIDSKTKEKIEKATNEGYNVTLVAEDDKVVGGIVLEDVLRDGIKETIARLRRMGIKKMVILTGDNEKVAEKISREAGIRQYHANLLPEQKTEYLKKYLGKEGLVAMVGDGVNDAPCLALADLGIAMGAIGSDAAIESADIAMMKDDITQLPEIIRVAKKTMQVVRQDFILWGFLNILGFTLVGIGFLNPSGAAAYNFLTDFIPILNSLQLIK